MVDGTPQSSPSGQIWSKNAFQYATLAKKQGHVPITKFEDLASLEEDQGKS
jgi:hypothetical protein